MTIGAAVGSTRFHASGHADSIPVSATTVCGLLALVGRWGMPLRGLLLVTAVFALAGCVASPAALPTSTPTPERPQPVAPPPNASLVVTGPEEVVFDWTTDACEPMNIPDLATRAFKDSTGRVQLLLSHAIGHRMVGSDLDSLSVDCTALWTSAFDPDPGQYQDATWIAAPYTVDGKTIYAIAHNEYQGNTHKGQCPSADYAQCVDTSLTLYVSTDGGDSYAPSVTPPAHFVGSMPEAYLPDSGPFGLRSPSNIVVGPDGALYMFANALQFGTQKQAMCLLRTEDITDPNGWRWWDGAEFSGKFIDPEQVAGGTQCRAVALDEIGNQLTESLSYNTELESYVLLGLSADHIDGREVWGFYVSFSRDLLTWSHRRLVAEMPLPWTVEDPGNSLSVLYPSLLDPQSTDRNFATTGSTAFVYYTRNNGGHASLDRDLMRIPVEFVLDEG